MAKRQKATGDRQYAIVNRQLAIGSSACFVAYCCGIMNFDMDFDFGFVPVFAVA